MPPCTTGAGKSHVAQECFYGAELASNLTKQVEKTPQ
jgi:hypothetical protein